MIPPGFLQELIGRTDIVDVVGRHVELKRGGANFMGLCPFHGEKSPSFSVSPSKQFYYCFGCGASGDAIRFLSEHLGLSFVEAVRDLAGRIGMAVPEEQVSPEERQRRDTLRQRRLSLGEVLTKAARLLPCPTQGPAACGELPQGEGPDGCDRGTLRFGLRATGLAHAGRVCSRPTTTRCSKRPASFARRRPMTMPRRRNRRATPTAAATTGSATASCFPIRGVDGAVIGFGGRVLDDSKPKYINSPETPVFSKGRELYGLFEARQALRDKGYALVVEGYMDVVALAQSGFANAVATLGTACTAEHVQKLFRFTDSVVFSFDGDAAGRRAAGRALEASLPHATDLRTVRFLFLPTEHDPDSYVRTLGPEAFEQQVTQAVPLSRQLIEQAADGADLTSAEGRARLLAQAKPLWQQLPDGALKRQLLPELARQGQLEAADLASLWGTAPAAAAGAPRPGAVAPADRVPRRAARRRARQSWRCACCCATATGGNASRAKTTRCCTSWAARTARSWPGSSGTSPNTAPSPGAGSTRPWPPSPGPTAHAPGCAEARPKRSRASMTCSGCCTGCGSCSSARKPRPWPPATPTPRHSRSAARACTSASPRSRPRSQRRAPPEVRCRGIIRCSSQRQVFIAKVTAAPPAPDRP